MKRIRPLACCVIAACLAMVMAGCSSQQAYTPPEKTPTLSTPVIGTEGVLRVGVNASTPPLAGSPSSSSKIVGIDVDMAAALADSFGLKLEIVDVGTDPEAALETNKVDIVMGIKQSDSEVKFWKSSAYLPTGVALFATSSNTTIPTKASAPKIAAQVSSTSAWQVTNEFGDEARVDENDLKSAFASLDAGKVQYVAADAIIGLYAAHGGGYDAQPIALMQQAGGYCVGVLDANTDLKQAISDALISLTDGGIISIIETKWLGSAPDIAALPLTEGAESAKSSSTTDKQQDSAANTTERTGTTEPTPGTNAVQPTS